MTNAVRALPSGEQLDLELRLLAREAAEQLRDRDLFGERNLKIDQLLKELGLVLRVDRLAKYRGHLSADERTVTVRYRSGPANRFVILHEIGHALLLRDHPALASEIQDRHHELFATCFALSMMVSDEKQRAICDRLYAIDCCSELVKAAASSRLSIPDLLRVGYDQPALALAMRDRVWLTVKRSVNKFTLRDPKLRIVSAYFDRTKWFVPTNNGVERIFGAVDWFSRLPIGQELKIEDVDVSIQKTCIGENRKYSRVRIKADVRIFGLRPVRDDSGIHCLVLASLKRESSDTLL